MSIHAKRTTFVIAMLVAFTTWGIGRRVGIIVSGHADRMTVGFVAADALHRLVVLVAASTMVCLSFYRQHGRQSIL